MARRISRRNRIRIIAVTMFCLLFQQLAVAAYVCPMGELPAGPVAMAECAAHESGQQPSRDALCQKHCAPDTSTGAEGRSAGVPLLALPAIVFQEDASRVVRSGVGWKTAPRAQDTAPPPTLDFTRLLI